LKILERFKQKEFELTADQEILLKILQLVLNKQHSQAGMRLFKLRMKDVRGKQMKEEEYSQLSILNKRFYN